MAIGNKSAAAALFVTTLLIKKVAKYTAPNKPASMGGDGMETWSIHATGT
jgi:hypothetical protein